MLLVGCWGEDTPVVVATYIRTHAAAVGGGAPKGSEIGDKSTRGRMR